MAKKKVVKQSHAEAHHCGLPDMNEMARLICEREGKKIQVNIAQVKEILRVLRDILTECEEKRQAEEIGKMKSVLAQMIGKEAVARLEEKIRKGAIRFDSVSIEKVPAKKKAKKK